MDQMINMAMLVGLMAPFIIVGTGVVLGLTLGIMNLMLGIVMGMVSLFGMGQDELDKAALTKELADLLYVVYGAAVTFGLPLDVVFNRVHASNMSKLLDGKPLKRQDGKVLKGPNYQPPKLDDLFNG